LWGLALDGEAGVARVLTTLRDELDTAMALCGCATLSDIGRDLVAT
jgi:4-hydroxymandelate oxidase